MADSKPPFPNLSTTRLNLRSLHKKDAEEVLFLRSDREVNQFVKRPLAVNIKEARKFIVKIQSDFIEHRSIYWVISRIEEDLMIGSVCLWNFSSDRSKAEVGYDLHPNFQNQGIMSEALTEVLRFGFRKLNLMEIKAYTQSNNDSSKQLLKKNSFILIENENDPKNRNNLIYSIKNPNRF